MTSQHWVIQARSISKTYTRGKEKIRALREVDLRVSSGEFIAILGPSGGGKSTLLHLLGAIDTLSAGQLDVCGVKLDQANESVRTRFRREKVGFVFQFYNLMPSLSALDNVALPLLAKGLSWSSARRSAAAALERMLLGHRVKHRPGELSGGEQQRVAIARALVTQPEIILADEPTGDLDSGAAQIVLEHLVDLNQHAGITLLIATHNLAVAAAAHHVYELRDGCISTDEEPA